MPEGCATALLARFMPAKDAVGGRAIYKPATIFVVVAGTIPLPAVALQLGFSYTTLN